MFKKTCNEKCIDTQLLYAQIELNEPTEQNTPWAIKRCHFYFYDNFGKRGPI